MSTSKNMIGGESDATFVGLNKWYEHVFRTIRMDGTLPFKIKRW